MGVLVFRLCTFSEIVGIGGTPDFPSGRGDMVVVNGHSGGIIVASAGVVQPLGVLLPVLAKGERLGAAEKYPSIFGRECRELLLKLVAERCLYGDGDAPGAVINSTEEVSEERGCGSGSTMFDRSVTNSGTDLLFRLWIDLHLTLVDES